MPRTSKKKTKQSDALQAIRITTFALKDHKGNVLVPEKTGGWHIVAMEHGKYYVMYCGCTLPMRGIDGIIALSNFDTLDTDKEHMCEFCVAEYNKEKEDKQ